MQKVATILQLHAHISWIILKTNKRHTNRIMQIVPCKTALSCFVELKLTFIAIERWSGLSYVVSIINKVTYQENIFNVETNYIKKIINVNDNFHDCERCRFVKIIVN